jgi:hypothetical protein
MTKLRRAADVPRGDYEPFILPERANRLNARQRTRGTEGLRNVQGPSSKVSDPTVHDRFPQLKMINWFESGTRSTPRSAHPWTGQSLRTAPPKTSSPPRHRTSMAPPPNHRPAANP